MLVVIYNHACSCFCYSRAKRKNKTLLIKIAYQKWSNTNQSEAVTCFQKQSWDWFSCKINFSRLLPFTHAHRRHVHIQKQLWATVFRVLECLPLPMCSFCVTDTSWTDRDTIALPNYRKYWWQLWKLFQNASFPFVYFSILTICDFSFCCRIISTMSFFHKL